MSQFLSNKETDEELRMRCIKEIYVMLLKRDGKVHDFHKWGNKYILTIKYERGVAKRSVWPKGE